MIQDGQNVTQYPTCCEDSRIVSRQSWSSGALLELFFSTFWTSLFRLPDDCWDTWKGGREEGTNRQSATTAASPYIFIIYRSKWMNSALGPDVGLFLSFFLSFFFFFSFSLIYLWYMCIYVDRVPFSPTSSFYLFSSTSSYSSSFFFYYHSFGSAQRESFKRYGALLGSI